MKKDGVRKACAIFFHHYMYVRAVAVGAGTFGGPET